YRNFKFQSAQDPELNQLSQNLKKFPASAPEYQQAKNRQSQLVAVRKAHLEEIYKNYPDAFFTKFKIAGQNPDWPEFRKANG
ncbi:MAG: hypothetical protein L6Q97_20305, partial [Thermoanaerobaculia bacterium]|nr:hypothetical protein [Thermoanaerobaculia bacterium]